MESNSRSYSFFPTTTSMVYRTIPDVVDEKYRDTPDNDYFVFLKYSGTDLPLSRTCVTWRDLRENSLKVAAALLKIGIKPGDRIAIYGRSIPNWLYLQHGAIRINVLCIPIPVSLISSDKLAAFLSGHRVKIIILDPGQDSDIMTKFAQTLPDFQNISQHSGSISLESFPSRVIFLEDSGSKVTSVEEFIKADLTQSDIDTVLGIQKKIDPDDVAIVFASSGSTGVPKMIMHSHCNIMSMNALYKGAIDFGKKFFNDRPFNWLGSVMYAPLVDDSTRVFLHADDMSPAEYAELMFRVFTEERITSALVMTFTLQDMKRMIRSGDNKLPETLKLIMTGGEKIPEDLIEEFNQWVDVLAGYASTEVPMLGLFWASDPKYKIADGEEIHLYRPTGPVEVKIVDEDGICVPYGTRGLLMTRQPTLFLGYLDDLDTTAASITRGRWFAPGDMALMHPSGSYQVLGRTSDMISKGGVKLYPARQEAMLMQHPKLAKVAVCSIPDDKYNEEICACVVPVTGCDITVDELRVHCQRNQPKDMRVPLYPGHFIITDNMPLLPNGKTDKIRVRAMFLELTSDKP